MPREFSDDEVLRLGRWLLNEGETVPPVARVHLAGLVAGNVQRCARCEYVLTDNSRNVMSEDGRGLSYWPEGALIEVNGPCTSLVYDDANRRCDGQLTKVDGDGGRS